MNISNMIKDLEIEYFGRFKNGKRIEIHRRYFFQTWKHAFFNGVMSSIYICFCKPQEMGNLCILIQFENDNIWI